MMKIKKENEGITLIALVVTIIVLLILAGVTISLIIGQNGIIGKANNADKQQTHASVKDQIALRILDLSAENSIEQNITKLKDYLISKNEAALVNNILELKITNLIGNDAKYGKGSNKTDVYTIENNTIYYYDKDGNQEKLEDLQIQEEVTEVPKEPEKPTDESYFDFDESTGTISIKDTDSYYSSFEEIPPKEAPIDTYVIPATYQGQEVKRVGHFNAPNIKKVVVLEGPTEIEWYAFYNCKSLQEVELPTTMKDISQAFKYCTALEKIYLPNSITNMDMSFEGCSNLKTVNIPKGVTGLAYTFMNCTSLTQIILPPTLKGLLTTFDGCTGIKEIFIPNTVESMGSSNFRGWSNNQTIYCEAESRPSGWNSGWNDDCNANIIWGYKK